MRVMANGGAGFIGSYVCRLLEREGHEVMVYDIDTSLAEQKFKGYDIIVVKGDVCSQGNMAKYIQRFKPDTVVHFAAKSIAKYCDRFPSQGFITNLSGLYRTLVSLNGVKRFVFVSSSFVYGDFKYTPVDEEHVKNPKGVYGGTKLAGEIITKTYCERFNVDWTVIRPSAVYGTGDRNRRVVQVLLEDAITKKPLKIEGADQLIDFTYVEDTAKGIYLALMSPNASRQAFNITRGEGRSLRDLVNIIRTYVPDIQAEEFEADEHRPKRGALDIYKARHLLGYVPEYSLEEGIKKYYNALIST